jgi:hypothetical protein
MLPETLKRFMSHVDPEPSTGCLLWTGTRTPAGYGDFRENGRHSYAHRRAYEHFIGPIPEGLTLDHRCRVRHCVNPTHLEPVTGRENALRGYGACAINARKTHCPRGHILGPENASAAYVKRGHRPCRTCSRARSAAYRLRVRTR